MTIGLNVSRETEDKLRTYAALIEKWTKAINLIAPNTVPDLWHRHILDSVQVSNLAPTDWTSWLDLGSGGGLPGLVVAILDTKGRPVTLVESDNRKCLFLNTVRRELSLNVTVLNMRIEDVETSKASIVSARALASLEDLLRMSAPLLDPKGTALFAKGERFKQELDRANEDWHFDVDAVQSQTNHDSRILKISRIRPRES